MLERTRYTDGLAAIYPPMMYVIMALDLLGYPGAIIPMCAKPSSSFSIFWSTTNEVSSSSPVFP